MNTTYSEKLADDLWEAVEKGDADQVQSLLDKGADPNHELYWREEWMSRKSDRWTVKSPPLHTACHNGNLEIVKLLVQRRASVNTGDGRFHWTPLHRACSKGHQQIVEYLIMEAKCDAGDCVFLSNNCSVIIV